MEIFYSGIQSHYLTWGMRIRIDGLWGPKSSFEKIVRKGRYHKRIARRWNSYEIYTKSGLKEWKPNKDLETWLD